uniref:Uncharacterized protein n=1 Tax=viral metagenome TaxID=1070528 RepID=A0A6H1ZXN4_9ZZZZ
MCQHCVNIVKKHWPDLPEDDYGTLLINATAWPFGGPETIAGQVKRLAEVSGQNIGKALAIADEECWAEMEDARVRDDNTS